MSITFGFVPKIHRIEHIFSTFLFNAQLYEWFCKPFRGIIVLKIVPGVGGLG